MIDFRYHIVSIVAVFLALAVGLLIGSTTLRPTVAEDIRHRTDRVVAQNRELNATNKDLGEQVKNDEQLENALLPYVVRGRLTGESVVIVSAPDADDSARNDLTDAITAAGGTVAGDIQLRDQLFDPDQSAFLQSLVSRLDVHPDTGPDATGNEEALAVLARGLAERPDRALPESASTQIVSAFETGNLVSVSGTPRPANLVVLLLGAPAPSPSPSASTAGTSPTPPLVTEFAADLARAATAVVAAGPADSADAGDLGAIRSDDSLGDKLSTVDGVEAPSGVIAAVLALVAQRDGTGGDFGVAAGEDPVPSLSPGP